MKRCKECGFVAPAEDFHIWEDGALLADECPRCASPEVFAFDPD
jgi:predicted Zn-ribbon and HTH transcriptional regulator